VGTPSLISPKAIATPSKVPNCILNRDILDCSNSKQLLSYIEGDIAVSNAGRKVIIAGNWKMNKLRKEALALAEQVKDFVKDAKDLPETILIPPFTSLESVSACVAGSKVDLGAQNMDYRDSGAFTGEISPSMLVDLGVKYILIGHSERRQFFGETNSTANLRLKAALAHGLKPILCVGEQLDERENNLTDPVVSRQVAAALAEIEESKLGSLTIAYEPVWAIGTGKTCDSVEANRVAALIRSTIAKLYATGDRKLGNQKEAKELAQSIPVLYGGSVKPSTIEEQLAQPEIDGALVGGASLKAEEFIALIKGAQKRVKLTPSVVKG
jgi:triosephosphate isomerase (TIM)